MGGSREELIASIRSDHFLVEKDRCLANFNLMADAKTILAERDEAIRQRELLLGIVKDTYELMISKAKYDTLGRMSVTFSLVWRAAAAITECDETGGNDND